MASYIKAKPLNQDAPKKLKKFKDLLKDNKNHKLGDEGISTCYKYIITDPRVFSELAKDPKHPDNKTVRKHYKLKFRYFVTESNLYMFNVIDERSSLRPTYTIAFRENEFDWL